MKKKMSKGIACAVLSLVLLLPCASFAADESYLPPDGIDFTELSNTNSSIFLGAYDHMASGTYGLAGGVQTREGTRRPLLWNILEAKDGKIELQSSYAVDALAFNATDGAGSFNYASSGIAADLASPGMLNAFSSAELSPLMQGRDILTSIYDAGSAELLDALYPGGLSWPLTVSAAKLSLPWARSMEDFSPGADRIYFSENGRDASAALKAGDKVASLRSSLVPAPYWTRSSHLGTGLNPATNEALYVSQTGAVKSAAVTQTFGLRPLAQIDTSKILLTQKIVENPANALEISADARLTGGAVSTDGNYYSADKERGKDAESYKLTVINDAMSLTSLALTGGKEIKKDGSTHIAVSGNDPLELTAVSTGVSTGMAYKIVRSVGQKREIVSYGKEPTSLFTLPLTGLSEDSPLPEGSYTVYVWSNYERQIHSNEGSAPLSFKLSIDKTAPATAISPQPGGIWHTGAIAAKINASDDASGIASLHAKINDENELAVSADEHAFTLSGDGIHTVRFYAKDASGNEEEVKEATYYLDNTAPVTTALPPGTYAPQTFALSASDPCAHARGGLCSGVATTYYRINNQPPATYVAPLSLTAPGTYTVQYWSVDKAGNAELPSVAHYVIKNPPSKINIVNKKPKTLLVGQRYNPGALAVPADADREIIWESRNPSVAQVSYDGMITAVAPGRAEITAKASFGDASESITVTVESPVSAFYAAQKTIHLTEGKTVSYPFIAATKTPSKVTLTWNTKKYGAATIQQGNSKTLAASGTIAAKGNGATYIRIKANKPGSTKLTITSLNGKSVIFNVVVHKKREMTSVRNVKIESPLTKNRLEEKKTATLKVKIYPAIATNAVASWKSSNPKVVTVDQAGRIIAVGSGKAQITVKAGGKTAKITIVAVKWKS